MLDLLKWPLILVFCVAMAWWIVSANQPKKRKPAPANTPQQVEIVPENEH